MEMKEYGQLVEYLVSIYTWNHFFFYPGSCYIRNVRHYSNHPEQYTLDIKGDFKSEKG